MLTNLGVEALKPAAARYLKTDKDGLCIDVLPSGIKSWVYRYRLNGKQEKTQLGQYPAMKLKAARLERGRLEQLVKAGTSPAGEKRQKKLQKRAGDSPSNPTIAQFCDRYYREHIEGRLKDPEQVRRYIDQEIIPAIGTRLLREVTALDVMAMVHKKRDQEKVRTALYLRAVMKGLFGYAVELHIISVNPASQVSPKYIGRTRPRTRALAPRELRIVLRTIEDSNLMRQFKLSFRIILLTMVRKGELFHARWEHVDLNTCEWAIPGELTKTGKPHTVYLAAQVADAFRELKILSCGSEFVLPGRDSQQRHMHESSLNTALDRLEFEGVGPWCIHDTRRTSSTILNSNGFSGDVIEAGLGHSQHGVRAIYNVSTYATERRKMLAWWADYIDSLVSGSNVVIGNFGA